MGTPLTTDDLRKIDQIEQMAAIQPTDMLVAQRPSAAAGRITAAQIAGYAADTYNVSGTCATAAASEYKDVTITGVVVPQTLAVTFTNANSFGDSTASTATYPKLRVYGTGQTLLTTLDICDSRGHTAGTGCWNAGDVILFRVIGIKALISNSDVRQSGTTTTTNDYVYTITADGTFCLEGLFRGTSAQQMVTITDSMFVEGDRIVSCDISYDGDFRSQAVQSWITPVPKIRSEGRLIYYARTNGSTISDGTVIPVHVMIVGVR